MKKIILIPIFVLICAVVVLYFFVFKADEVENTENKIQNNNEIITENELKTYKDEVNNFSFEYPKDGELKKYSDTNVTVSFFSVFVEKEVKSNSLFIVNVSGYDIEKNETIEDWWSKYGPQVGRQAPYPDEEKLIKVAGEDAYYTVYDSESNTFGFSKTAVVFIYIGHNGKVYEISGDKLPVDPKAKGLTSEEIKTVQEYEKVFAKILESFKFID